jgi:hypothetical protein
VIAPVVDLEEEKISSREILRQYQNGLNEFLTPWFLKNPGFIHATG